MIGVLNPIVCSALFRFMFYNYENKPLIKAEMLAGQLSKNAGRPT
jgi:hypothetical protein